MAHYALRRIIQSIPILLGISILIFLIVQLAPGSADRPLPQSARVARAARGDHCGSTAWTSPLPEQYVHWITAFVQVWRPDAWGYSFIDGQPVLGNITNRVPATVILMGSALIVTLIVSIPVGILAAIRQYSKTDKVITTFATIGYAIPSFLSASTSCIFGGVVLYQLTGFGFPLFGRQTPGWRRQST